MLTPAPGAKFRPPHATVSVVLPNYNHAKLIGRAFAALRAQASPPNEVVIIDDASTDESLRIIEDLAAEWPVVRVVANTENQGTIAALACGLDACSGKYVYFAAADDWIEPGFFSTAIDMLERHPQAGLFCGEASLVDGQTGRKLGTRPVVRPAGHPRFFTPSDVAGLFRSSDNWILTGSALFRRDRVLDAGGFSSDLGSFADGYLARKIALRHGFCFAPAVVATWSIFDKGVSRAMAADATRAALTIDRALTRIAADSAFPHWYSGLCDRRWRFAISRLAVIAKPMNRPVLLRLGVRSRFGRTVLGAISSLRLEAMARPLLLGWLWLRFRPMSLWALSRTAFARYWERRSKDGHERTAQPPEQSGQTA